MDVVQFEGWAKAIQTTSANCVMNACVYMVNDIRDELKSDQLLLKTELNRRQTVAGKQKNNIFDDLEEPAPNGTWRMCK